MKSRWLWLIRHTAHILSTIFLCCFSKFSSASVLSFFVQVILLDCFKELGWGYLECQMILSNSDRRMKRWTIKIYQWLQAWYLELQTRKIPEAKNWRSFEQFKLWLLAEKEGDFWVYLLMTLDPLKFAKKNLTYSAVLQSMDIDFNQIYRKIMVQTQPILLIMKA